MNTWRSWCILELEVKVKRIVNAVSLVLAAFLLVVMVAIWQLSMLRVPARQELVKAEAVRVTPNNYVAELAEVQEDLKVEVLGLNTLLEMGDVSKKIQAQRQEDPVNRGLKP